MNKFTLVNFNFLFCFQNNNTLKIVKKSGSQLMGLVMLLSYTAEMQDLNSQPNMMILSKREQRECGWPSILTGAMSTYNNIFDFSKSSNVDGKNIDFSVNKPPGGWQLNPPVHKNHQKQQEDKGLRTPLPRHQH